MFPKLSKEMHDNLMKITNDLLRGEIKSYLNYKRQTHSHIIIKENFIFDVVLKTLDRYLKVIYVPGLEKDLFALNKMSKKIVIAIIERHAFYIEGLSDNKRLKYQKDEDYKESLIKETIDDLAINKYSGGISMDLDLFYYPPISKIVLLNNLMFELFKQSLKDNTRNAKYNAIITVLSRVMEQVKSAAILLDKDLIADAISVWRTLHESELIIVILSYYPEDISLEYLEFIEYQITGHGIKLKEDLEEKLNEKAKLRGVNPSVNFINYGWLMATEEFYDLNCNLNIKDGLSKIAGTKIDYTSYQFASSISHSPFISKVLNKKELKVYVVEMLAHSIYTIIDAIYYYLKELQIEVDEETNIWILNTKVVLDHMIEHMKRQIKVKN